MPFSKKSTKLNGTFFKKIIIYSKNDLNIIINLLKALEKKFIIHLTKIKIKNSISFYNKKKTLELFFDSFFVFVFKYNKSLKINNLQS